MHGVGIRERSSCVEPSRLRGQSGKRVSCLWVFLYFAHTSVSELRRLVFMVERRRAARFVNARLRKK